MDAIKSITCLNEIARHFVPSKCEKCGNEWKLSLIGTDPRPIYRCEKCGNFIIIFTDDFERIEMIQLQRFRENVEMIARRKMGNDAFEQEMLKRCRDVYHKIIEHRIKMQEKII